MSYCYKLLKENECELIDEYNDKYFYQKRETTNSEKNRIRFVYKNNLTDLPLEFGEVLASIVGKRTINNVCDCELAKRKIKGRHPEAFEYGVISYFNVSDEDKLILPSTFLEIYLDFINASDKCLSYKKTNIEICLKAIFYYMSLVLKRPYEEIENVKQQFIDMVMFDCMYGNCDRGIDNWMLIQNKETGKISLYSLYDNESFLGFDQQISKFKFLETIGLNLTKSEISKMEKQLILDYNSNLKMKEVIPQDQEKGYSNYEDILRYLFDFNYRQSMEAYKKLTSFTYYDLEELLNQFPDIPEERKVIAKRIFISRELMMHRIVQERLNSSMENHDKTL